MHEATCCALVLRRTLPMSSFAAPPTRLASWYENVLEDYNDRHGLHHDRVRHPAYAAWPRRVRHDAHEHDGADSLPLRVAASDPRIARAVGVDPEACHA